MAIIVDKVQKKREIALACKELIVTSGMQDPTIAKIAETAGIGKGTFYEYFKSKEALLFELVNILMNEYNIELEKQFENIQTTKEKIKIFAAFFYAEESADLRILYKMFTGMSLLHAHEETVAFQTECFDTYYLWFEKIIDEGVKQGEIVPEAMHMTKGIFATAKGMFVASETTHSIESLKEELNGYIDTLFKLLATV